MWKLSVAAAVGGLVLAPALAMAQAKGGETSARHEFGVDLSLMYTHIGSGCTTDCSLFSAVTPLDVRIAFHSSGPLAVEPRFGLSYVTGGGGHVLHFTPDINLLYAFGAHRVMGPYLTAGVGVDLTDVGVSGGTSASATQLSINVGIGTRKPWGTGAFRPEAFFRYNFENTSKGIPSSFDLGARIGLSFFH
jgi:hypothetical protein